MVGLSLGAILAIKLFHKLETKVVKRYIIVETCFLIFAGLSFFIVYNFQDQLITFLTPQSFLKDGLITIGLLLPASIAMGMSLPILIDLDKNRHKHEKVYALNTIGGALGVVFFGFVLLKYFGYTNMMYFIPLLSAINIFCIILILKKKKLNPQIQTQKQTQNKHAEIKIKRTTIITISALSGFIIFLLEVLWFRHLEIIIGDRAYISSIILFTIIITLGVSSYLSGYLTNKSTVNKIFRYSITFTILSFLISQLFIPQVFFLDTIVKTQAYLKILFIIFSFLIPIFLLGLTFPILLKLIQQSHNEKVTATSLGINSFFSMCGTLIGSYIIIETLGVNSIYVISSILLIIILLIVENEYKTNYFFSAIASIVFILFISLGVQNLHVAPQNMILYEKQTPLTHFTVVKTENYEMYAGNYRLVYTYKAKNVNYAQKALAFAPALYHEKPKKILSIGLGYGITVGSLLRVNPEFIDSVELIQSTYDMSFLYHEFNNKQHLNPKVNTHIDDGRRFLARSNKRYDIITASIVSPYSISGSFFLTQEYYKIVKEKLNENGVYAQLIWGFNNTEIIHTIKSVFPYMTAVPGYDLNEIVILASKKPLELKKNINSYDEFWPLYENLDRKTSFKFGDQVINTHLKDQPKFIISDYRADMIFEFNKEIGFLWTRE